MNIFEDYLEKINDTIRYLYQDHKIQLYEKEDIPEEILNKINVDTVPEGLDFDISTNIAMSLFKPNKGWCKSPIDLANFLIPYLKDENMKNISVTKPGFINIKFKAKFWTNFVKEIIDNAEKFGINHKEKKIII